MGNGNRIYTVILVRGGKTYGGGHGGAAVTCHKGVVLTLRRIGESADTALTAQGIKPHVAVGEQLVGVALMAHVPHDSIIGRGKHTMHSHRQLHRTQVRGQMAAGAGNGLHHLLTHLGAEVGELFGIHFFDVFGRVDVFQSLHTTITFILCFPLMVTRQQSLCQLTQTVGGVAKHGQRLYRLSGALFGQTTSLLQSQKRYVGGLLILGFTLWNELSTKPKTD